MDTDSLAMHFDEVHPDDIEVPKCNLCLQVSLVSILGRGQGDQTYNTIAICPFVCVLSYRNRNSRGEEHRIERRFFLSRGDRGRGSVRFYVLLFAQIIIIFMC